MTVLKPANAFPNLAFPQHLSGQTKTVTSYTYPGAVWPKATGPAVLSYTNAFPNRLISARGFNGVSDFISLGNSATLNPSPPFTISLWAYFLDFIHTADSGEAWLFARDDAVLGRAYAFGLTGLPGSPGLHFQYNGSGIASPTVLVSANQWYHLAVVATSSATTIYQNGVNITSAGTGVTFNSTTGNTTIGARTYSGFQGFSNELIADIGFWSTALNGTQIANLAAGARASSISGNLIVDLPITGASPEPDISGNGFNGALTGTFLAAGPSVLSSYPTTGLAFPQHLSGQTNTVQNFLYPGAVQPQFISFLPAWALYRNFIVQGMAT